MICNTCYGELKKLVTAGIISEAQWAQASSFLRGSRGEPSTTSELTRQEASKSFNPIMVLYYIGALLILSAFGWFMGSQWDALGSGGILSISLLYAMLFIGVGRFLIHQERFLVAGGLLITCAVGMTPLITYSLQSLLHVWPMQPPGSYPGYYVWINGSWIIIEMATVLASLFALRKVRFSFLVMPAAIALWFFSMDIAEIFSASHTLTWTHRSWTSVVCGVLFLLVGRVADEQEKGTDTAFWIYLAGLLAFWGGLTSLPSQGEFGRLIYAFVNVGLLIAGLYLNRKTFAVFATMGLFTYVGHLAWTLFKDSPIFPIALAFVGLMMILCTVVLQKNYSKLERYFHA